MLSFDELVAQCDRTRRAMLPLPAEAVEAFQEWGYWQMPQLPVKPEPTPEERFNEMVERCRVQRALFTGKQVRYLTCKPSSETISRYQGFVEECDIAVYMIGKKAALPEWLIASIKAYHKAL